MRFLERVLVGGVRGFEVGQRQVSFPCCEWHFGREFTAEKRRRIFTQAHC